MGEARLGRTVAARWTISGARAWVVLGLALGGCAAVPEVDATPVAGDAISHRSLIWGASDNEAWIVGTHAPSNAGAIARWDGQRATLVSHPPFVVPRVIAGTSARDVWVVTDGVMQPAQVLRWNGEQWSIVHTFEQSGLSIDSIVALAPDNVWIGGSTRTMINRANTQFTPWLARWDGTRFEQNLFNPTMQPRAQVVHSLVVHADGEAWLRASADRATYHHPAGAPLTEWQRIADRESNGRGELIGASDGAVLLMNTQLSRWNDASQSFEPTSTAALLSANGPARGVALGVNDVWTGGVEAYGPERCGLSGGALGGISWQCSPAGYFPALLHWNGARWSSTSLSPNFRPPHILWREPTSGALWVGDGALMGRVRADQLRP